MGFEIAEEKKAKNYFTKDIIEVLKNFSKINQNLEIINENYLSTITQDWFIAYYDVSKREYKIPKISLFNISEFLEVLTHFDFEKTQVDFKEDRIVLTQYYDNGQFEKITNIPYSVLGNYNNNNINVISGIKEKFVNNIMNENYEDALCVYKTHNIPELVQINKLYSNKLTHVTVGENSIVYKLEDEVRNSVFEIKETEFIKKPENELKTFGFFSQVFKKIDTSMDTEYTIYIYPNVIIFKTNNDLFYVVATKEIEDEE